MFSEFLPFYNVISSNETLISQYVRKNHNDVHTKIAKILDFYLIKNHEDGLVGWPALLVLTDNNYDAYSSANVLDYILSNNVNISSSV